MRKSRGKRRNKKIFRNYFYLMVLCAILVFAYKNVLGSLVYNNTNIGLLSSKDSIVKDIKFKDINVDLINSNRFLELVNSSHSISSTTEYKVVPAFKSIPLSTSDINIDSTVLEELKKLLSDAGKSGYNNFYINSGHRTYNTQKQLYDKAVDKEYVQKPNNSEHQTGLAVDIVSKGISGDKMGDTKEAKWLQKNAWEYGFILRYPEGKADITNIKYEPWHFRYIGLPHAYYCYQNNLCMEEYIDFLKENGEYNLELNGVTYRVFYKTPRDGIIQVPKDMDYKISADNTGGFIITVEVM